jgi:hypothetical protein
MTGPHAPYVAACARVAVRIPTTSGLEHTHGEAHSSEAMHMPANFSADDHRVEHTDLFQPGPLIRHTFSDVLWWPAGKSASPAKADRGRS